MKDFEIGTDIQQISDFANPKKNFLEKIFTKKEIEYCTSKTKPSQHFAARFAAKEAVIKAFSQHGEKVSYKDIEILIKQAKPLINIKKKLSKRYTVKSSMSHSGEYALGFALIKNESRRNSQKTE